MIAEKNRQAAFVDLLGFARRLIDSQMKTFLGTYIQEAFFAPTYVPFLLLVVGCLTILWTTFFRFAGKWRLLRYNIRAKCQQKSDFAQSF
jgi:hypothetical protein